VSAQSRLNRSVRFSNLSMEATDPTSTPVAAPVVDSAKLPSIDPMDVWRSEPLQGDETAGPVPTLSARPRPPVSVASSASSLRRRQEYQRRFEQETAARQRRFEEEQEAARIKLEEELRLADLESEAGSVRPIPRGSAGDEQTDVAQRRLARVEQESASLQAEADSLRRVIGRKLASSFVLDPRSRSLASDSPPAAVDLFGHAKLKVDKPKAWSGQFDHLAREGFIRSVTNYFVSVRITPDTPIDATVLGVVRALFSADAPKSGGVSPQRWFDSQMDRNKFGSLADIFASMRAHWVDRDASDRARRALRTAEQGTMKAQEFGAVIDSLADECFDRVYDDDSRRDFFVDGLRREVREFYRVQLATWKDVHGDREPPFAKAVEIAARSDLFSGRAAEPYAAKSFSSPASKPLSGTKSLHVPKQPAIATTAPTSLASAAPASHWYDAATKWQAEHPMSQKATWHRSDGPELSKEVRCWNCGKVARHYSTACPNTRVDLRKVIVAAIAHLGGDASLVGLGDPDSGMAGREAESESRIVEIEAPGKE
jgi:hypothetical protein